MAEIDREELQQDLFLELADSAKKPERFIPQNKINKPIPLNTSVEQLILIGIIMILAGCFVFFLGVLRGKSLGSNPTVLRPQKKIVTSPAVTPAQPALLSAGNHPAATALSSEIRQAGPPPKAKGSWSPGKPYTLQLSTYRKQDLAEKEVSALRRSGYFSIIIPSDGYYQVCVGQYATKEDAKKDIKMFGAKFKGCFLRRH